MTGNLIEQAYVLNKTYMSILKVSQTTVNYAFPTKFVAKYYLCICGHYQHLRKT